MDNQFNSFPRRLRYTPLACPNDFSSLKSLLSYEQIVSWYRISSLNLFRKWQEHIIHQGLLARISIEEQILRKQELCDSNSTLRNTNSLGDKVVTISYHVISVFFFSKGLMNLEGKGSEREEAGSRHMASNLSRPVYIFSFHSSCKFFRSLSEHKKKSEWAISTTA